tara:strand:- start:104 stop:1735 length:1632 start_codon:yes stop_codon:yes gene_type:complete
MLIKNNSLELLEKTLKEGNISFFFSKRVFNPEFAKLKKKGIINFFSYRVINNKNIKLIEDFSDISRLCGDVCFLEKKSMRCLTIGYPYRANYVLFRPSFSFSFLISIPGFIRRLYVSAKRLNNKIDLLGIYKLKTDYGNTNWVVLKNSNAMVPTQFTLDEKIGVQGFIEFLNLKIKDYVFIRFFEKLPNLNREGGDLDIVVSDEKWGLLKEFLFNNPGKILIDMYGVSKPSNGVMLPYYPPKIAKQIINNSVIGPAKAKVPNNQDYLLSFIYHCVYHKGYTSGIKSISENYKTRVKPDNDYTYHIEKLFKLNNIKHESITLEMLDNYMLKNDWRPQSDTLSFIALVNPWLKKYLGSQIEKREVGLSVLILKQKYFKSYQLEIIRKLIIDNDFKIIKEIFLKNQSLQKAIDILRGGNWLSAVDGDEEYLPEYFMIIKDNTSRFKLLNHFGVKTNSIRLLKNKLRKVLDNGNHSIIHATDNSSQAIEYIDLIIDKFSYDEILKNDKLSFKDIFYGTIILPNYLFYILKNKIKNIAANVVKKIFRI